VKGFLHGALVVVAPYRFSRTTSIGVITKQLYCCSVLQPVVDCVCVNE